MRNKGHRLHSIGLSNPLRNGLCKNVSHANNKKFFAFRDAVFLVLRPCVHTLIFPEPENCIVIGDSAIKMLAILLTDFPSQFLLLIQ